MFKKKNIFFEALENISDNLHEAAIYFAEGIGKPENYTEFAKEMKERETKGDEFTHTIYIEINKTFITPIEREDILALTTSLDDVLDGIEAVSSRLEIYKLEKDDYFIAFADVLTRMTTELKTTIHMLSSKKLLQMREHTININRLENEADDLLRQSIRELFDNEKDPIQLIKKKEIYEMLESATDDCEDVANTLESLIMRNS